MKNQPYIRVPFDKVKIPGKTVVFMFKVKRKLKRLVRK